MGKITKILTVVAGIAVFGCVATETVFMVKAINTANQAVAVASAAEAKIADVKDGKDGKDGIDGVDGRNGLDGLNGHDGRDGIDGKDGRGITSAIVNEDGHLIITYTDGTISDLGKVTGEKGKDGKDGVDGTAGEKGDKGDKGDTGDTGADGKAGVGIASATINEDGDLIITLTDGSVINAGHVVGKDGVDGKDGKDAASSLVKENNTTDDTDEGKDDGWYTPSEVYDAIKSTARMVSKPALNDVGLKGYVAGYSDSLLYVSTAKFSSYTEATKDSTSYLEISTSTNFCTDPSLGMSIGQEINVIVDDVICSQNGSKKCLFATVDTLAVLDGDVVNDVSNRKLTTL